MIEGKFAIAAMQSLITIPETRDWTRAQIAQEAYMIADAMLAEANRRLDERVAAARLENVPETGAPEK